MKTFLVTGANSGLGLETTRQLAQQGHRVIMAVRDRARGEAAREAVAQQVPGAALELLQLDLADLDSVRAVGQQRLAVDVLINNAGVGSVPLQKTREGVYLQFGANHLGHFLLSALLFPTLERAPDPRVVTVGSGFGRKGHLDLSNLDASRGYGQGRAYMQSKLANSLFAAELDRRLRATGAKAKSVLAHPGVAATPMQQKPTGLVGVLSRAVSRFLARPAENGALPTVLAATGAEVQGGEIYGPGKGKRDPPRLEPRWPSFDDLEAARLLWARSEELTRVKWL